MKYKETLLWRKSLDLAIGIDFLIRNLPMKEEEANGIYLRLLETGIRVPFKIAESYEPYFNDAEELLLQARDYVTQISYLIQWSYNQGFFSYNDKNHLDGYCNDIREMINKTIRRSLLPEHKRTV